MATGTEAEVISILRMLTTKMNPVAEDLIMQLLNHPSDLVKLEALKLIDNQYPDIKPKLHSLLSSDVSSQIQNETVKTISRIADTEEEVREYLEGCAQVLFHHTGRILPG